MGELMSESHTMVYKLHDGNEIIVSLNQDDMTVALWRDGKFIASREIDCEEMCEEILEIDPDTHKSLTL